MSNVIRLHIQSLHHESLYNLDTLARLSGAQHELIAHYVRMGLLDPVAGRSAQEWQFDDSSLFRVRKIQRLRSELGININGVGVVLELLGAIEELQQTLARVHKSH